MRGWSLPPNARGRASPRVRPSADAVPGKAAQDPRGSRGRYVGWGVRGAMRISGSGRAVTGAAAALNGSSRSTGPHLGVGAVGQESPVRAMGGAGPQGPWQALGPHSSPACLSAVEWGPSRCLSSRLPGQRAWAVPSPHHPHTECAEGLWPQRCCLWTPSWPSRSPHKA